MRWWFLIGRFCRRHGLITALLGALCPPCDVDAEVSVGIERLPNLRVRVFWPNASGDFELQSTTNLTGAWQPSGLTPQISGGQQVVELNAGDSTHFFRLRELSGRVLTIDSSSPAPGESGVAVTRETIFRLTGAMATDTTLGTNNVYAMATGRQILSRVELSDDRATVTLFYLERLPADSRVEVVFDGAGLFDSANHPADLDNDGVPGGIARLQFETVSTTGLSTTGIEGYVYASEKNGDGTDRPLENVTITVDGMEETLRTTSSSNGFFRLQPCPAGRFFVSVDGRTAVGSAWPGGAYYPFVGKAWEAAPGLSNNLAGGSGVIYLPLIQADALRSVSPTEVTQIGFAPSLLATNPALAGVEISVPPNTLFADDGTRGGRVGIAPVPPDRLPEPLPAGLNLPLVITIQTDGPRNFDQPVPVRFPNLPDPVTGVKLGPGEKTVLWSFNHDTGRWEPQGTMTISADGNFAISDPGVGVRQPGWHGVAPGSGGGGPGGGGPGGPKYKDCEDANNNGICDEDDAKRCETDKLKTIFAGVDTAIGFVPQPDMGPLGSCLNSLAQVIPQGIRDCSIDPNGCRETIALKLLDFSIDCGLSFVPTSKGFKVALEWIKKIKGLFDLGLAYANWQLCKDTPPTGGAPLSRQAISVGGFATRGNPFLQQYEVEVRLHRFIELTYGNARWAEIDPGEWPLTSAIIETVRAATQAGSSGGKAITSAERETILALERPELITPDDVQALISRLEKLLNHENPSEGPLDSNGIIDAGNSLSAILSEVAGEGWTRAYDGWGRAVTILASLSQTGNVVANGATPLQRQSAPLNDVPMPARPLFYRLIDVGAGFERFGRLNSQGRFDGIILRPSALHLVIYFDPLTGAAGMAYFTSAAAGQPTIIPGASLGRSPAIADTDGDGLSDVAEAAVGTSSDNVDSDGDGVSDSAEIINGTDPTDGQALGLGVVATRATPGDALEIDTVNDFAVVADYREGLSVFDVANPLSPILVNQLKQSNLVFEAVAAAGSYIAAVPGVGTTAGARIHTFRLSPDGTLTAGRSVLLGADPAALVAAGRYAYAPGRSANAPTVVIARLSDAALIRHVPVPGGAPVTCMALDGDVLWCATGVQLLSYKIVGDNLELMGQLPVANLQNAPLEPGPSLIAGNGRVYLGDFVGFRVFDAANPAVPALLHAPANGQAAIHDFTLSGEKWLVPVTSFGGTVSLAVSLYDISGDRATNFVASFDTPGNARAAMLHRGYVLTADDSKGLAVVNFLSPDRGTNPPSVALRPILSHPGAGQEADQAFFVSTITKDDVQVRDVDFYIDGALAGRSGKFPFAATLTAPDMAHGKVSFILRAKATDTGGNSAWSDPMTITLLPDLTPARVVFVDPPADAVLPRGSVSSVTAVFDSALDLSSLQAAWTLVHAGLDGKFATADDQPITGQLGWNEEERTATLRYGAPLLSGKYRARIASSLIDAAGLHLESDVVWEFTIPVSKVVSASPIDKGVLLSGAVPRFELRFDERLTPASVTTASLRLTTTNQANPVTITGGAATVSADARTAILTFAQPVADGSYRLVLSPEIRDVYGSPIDTNFPLSITMKGPTQWVSDTSGIWTTGTNWSIGIPPILNDHVIIDRPSADPTVTLRSGTTLTTLRSEEPFIIDQVNGQLTVTDRAIFNGPLTVNNISQGITAKFLESRGPALLNKPLVIGEGLFEGPVTINQGDFALRFGTSRFLNRFDSTRTTLLDQYVLILGSGAVGTLTDNQVQFARASSFVIDRGARLEVSSSRLTNPNSSFYVHPGSIAPRLENAGDLVKKNFGFTYIGAPLTNTGNVLVEEGKLGLVKESFNSGTMEVRAGTTLELGSGFLHSAGRIFGGGYLKIASTGIFNAPLEITGTNEMANAVFNAPIQSSALWLITASATFNATPQLTGPVILDGARLIVNAPGESRIPDLRLQGNSRLGGSGLLAFPDAITIAAPYRFVDSLTARFDAPVTIATNLTAEDSARIELHANSKWVGGFVSGNIQIPANVVLELAPTGAASFALTLPFPISGILRKTSSSGINLSPFEGQNITNQSLIDILGGSVSTTTIFVQQAGELHLSAETFFVTAALRHQGGVISGSGTLHVRSGAVNRGCQLAAAVSPGEPYGIFKFAGEGFPIWEDGSRAVIDIGGTTPGVDRDQIVVERDNQINGGTLEIRTAPGFTPAVGQEFTIFTMATRRGGTFPETVGLELPNGRHYRVIYEAKSIKLRVE